MRLHENIDFTTLTWVKPELDETLRQARNALQNFVEEGESPAELRTCAALLHQVQGTLRMVELYGAAMVAEEMEQLAEALVEAKVENRDSAYAVLMQGIVQLPDYLERLQSGHRDIPIVLLPLLNQLRESRGEKGLSESVLFSPDLSRPLPASASGPASPLEQGELRRRAEALRGLYQSALLRWLKDDQSASTIRDLTDVCEQLVPITSAEPARRLFWVAAGTLDALAKNAFPISNPLKQALSKIEREIKRLADAGDAAFRSDPPVELTKQLLYFVAHEGSDVGRIGEIRQVFGLSGNQPSESEMAHARGSLSGNNRALLETVAVAIKEDLLRVKDALDLHLRTPGASLADLGVQVDALDRVADTLGMLGLGVPRRVVQDQRTAIHDVISGQRKNDEDTLLDIAGALLYVEAALDDQVERLGKDDGAATEASGASASNESRRLLEVLVKEAIINFGQARQCFVAFVETHWDHSQLTEVPRLLTEVSGALRILNIQEPADYLIGIRQFTDKELLQRRQVPTGLQMDRLADALASLEYYLEALRDRRPNRQQILQVARESLGALGYWPLGVETLPTSAPMGAAVAVVQGRAPARPDLLASQAPAAAQAVEESSPAVSEPVISQSQPEHPAAVEPPASSTAPSPAAPFVPTPAAALGSAPPPSVAAPSPSTAAPASPAGSAAPVPGFDGVSSEEIDDEIREVFLEEFDEEIENLAQLLPAWRAEPGNSELLRPIRRVFHTLKGSGRLVGAKTLGEFSWKVEGLLNRVLDGSRPASPQVFALVQLALDHLPLLRAALQGEQHYADLEGIQAVADRLSAGEEASYATTSVVGAEPAMIASPDAAAAPEPEVVAEAEPEMAGEASDLAFSIDPVLLEILKPEVAGHLEVVDAWLATCAARGPQLVSDLLLRSIHTMNGAFAMTDVVAITDVTAPLEGFVKRALAHQQSPGPAGVALIADTVAAIRATMLAIESPRPVLPQFDELSARAYALRDSLPDAMHPTMALHEDIAPVLPQVVMLEAADLSAIPEFARETQEFVPAAAVVDLPELESAVQAEAASIPAQVPAESFEGLELDLGELTETSFDEPAPEPEIALPLAESNLDEQAPVPELALPESETEAEVAVESFDFEAEAMALELEDAGMAPAEVASESVDVLAIEETDATSFDIASATVAAEAVPEEESLEAFLVVEGETPAMAIDEPLESAFDEAEGSIAQQAEPEPGPVSVFEWPQHESAEPLAQAPADVDFPAEAEAEFAAEASDASEPLEAQAQGDQHAQQTEAADASAAASEHAFAVEEEQEFADWMDAQAAVATASSAAEATGQWSEPAVETTEVPEPMIPEATPEMPDDVAASSFAERDVEASGLPPVEAETADAIAVPATSQEEFPQETALVEHAEFPEETALVEHAEFPPESEFLSLEAFLREAGEQGSNFAVDEAPEAAGPASVSVPEHETLADPAALPVPELETFAEYPAEPAPPHLDAAELAQSLAPDANAPQVDEPAADAVLATMIAAYTSPEDAEVATRDTAFDQDKQLDEALHEPAREDTQPAAREQAWQEVHETTEREVQEAGFDHLSGNALEPLPEPEAELIFSENELANADDLLNDDGRLAAAGFVSEQEVERASLDLESEPEAKLAAINEDYYGMSMAELEALTAPEIGSPETAEVAVAAMEVPVDDSPLVEAPQDLPIAAQIDSGQEVSEPEFAQQELHASDDAASFVEADGFLDLPMISDVPAWTGMGEPPPQAMPDPEDPRAGLAPDMVVEEVQAEPTSLAPTVETGETELSDAVTPEPAELATEVEYEPAAFNAELAPAAEQSGEILAEQPTELVVEQPTELVAEQPTELVAEEALLFDDADEEEAFDDEPEPVVAAMKAPDPVHAVRPDVPTAQDPADPDSELDVSDLDTELLDLFLEESNDLLDHSDGMLSRLRDKTDDRESIVNLQRDLHTLKGGARMAGIYAVGELGHAMESLLESVAEGRRSLDAVGVIVLERGFDRLHGMVARIGERKAIALPAGLIAQVEALAEGKTVDQAEVLLAESAKPAVGAHATKGAAPAKGDGSKLEPLSAPREEAVAEDDMTGVRAPQEQVRIRADLLDRLVNYAGEVAIYRARLEQQLGAFRANLGELNQTTTRLREQLRRLDIETEAQIVARYQREGEAVDERFDPLELDRFTNQQQLTRALNESANDLVNLQGVLDELTRQYETLLLQQSRVSSDLQEGLMRTRMVPFDALVPRLRRVLRQAATDTGKQVQLKVDGASGEMDRNVLERMTAPLEHMLRNAMAHGLELPQERRKLHKPEEGTVRIVVQREGSEVVLKVIDDGRGLNKQAIRDKAVERGLIKADAEMSDQALYSLILEAGFSTAETVSRLSGRGVGMDVVYSEIRQLGGTLQINSVEGKGSEFIIRLPFTLAVTQAVFVKIGDTSFAVPIASVQGVGRIARADLEKQLATQNPVFSYAGEDYAIHDLGHLIGHAPAKAQESLQMPLLLARSGDLRTAISIDQVLGSREIVVKPVGPQVNSVPGIFGATIMGDGRVVVILDVAPLVRRQSGIVRDLNAVPAAPAAPVQRIPVVMVVDDSITMRKVTGRVLERNNMEVLTAKDGVDAVEKMAERVPDLVLLDIEMPRMDGYEVAQNMRSDPRLKDVPIIMITSRTGDKHRQRAMDIGVNRYLGKPYQEPELMRNVFEMLGMEPVDV